MASKLITASRPMVAHFRAPGPDGVAWHGCRPCPSVPTSAPLRGTLVCGAATLNAFWN